MEKGLYLPKDKPQVIDIPEFKFITIQGVGSPSESVFTDCVGALYSLAYTIKMPPKKGVARPKNTLTSPYIR